MEPTVSQTGMWIYFSIGGFALLLALISLVFAEIGDFFHDIASPIESWMSDHFSFGHDHDVGFSRLVNNGGILGFLAGFGFIAALVMSQFNVGAAAAAGYGFLGGVVTGVFMGLIWYLLKRSEGTVGSKIVDLVGKYGNVSEKIFQGGVGKVACTFGDMPSWYTAVAEDGNEIAAGTVVKIVRVVGSKLYVLPETPAATQNT